MSAALFSAPGELYSTHIELCKKRFDVLFPVFSITVSRIFGLRSKEDRLHEFLKSMILFHDLGKLTKTWQHGLKTHKPLPAHAPIGAAYLWKILPDGIRAPLSFAVAIHHTDRGLLGDNIERPDVQAILENIVDETGKVKWCPGAQNLGPDFFPETAQEINLDLLKDMALDLRRWARGCSLLEQHHRRLQAFLAHHILKLCDVSAAIERMEYKKDNEKDYYGGWLMVENIKNYVEAITARAGQ